MAVKARAEVTISCIRDLQSCTRYYLLQSSTLAKPVKPTAKPPGGSWVTTEPSYTAGSTNSLYFCDLNVFSDGSYAYSDVSLSSSYEAAKAAYNKAQSAQDAVDNLEVGGRNLFINTLSPDASAISRYPRLLGQTTNTQVRAGSLVTAAEHGIRDTVDSALKPYIYFGTGTFAQASMNGLEVGKTYTISFDWAGKLLSGTATATRYLRVFLMSDATDGSGTWGTTTALGVLYKDLYTYSAALGNYGEACSGHCNWTFTIPETATRISIQILVGSAANAEFAAGDWTEVSNLMLVEGNATTDWTPAPEDLDAKINRALSSTEVVVGTQTAATGTWTGNASFSSLEDGQTIMYWLPYAGSGNATLNLTLPNGTKTGAKNVYINATTRCTTHIAAGNMVQMVYRENVAIGSGTYTGWWISRALNDNNYDRIRFNNSITAKSAITAYYLIVGDDTGFYHLKGATAFDINKPILYAASAIAANATGTNNYLSIPTINLRTPIGDTTWTATKGATCYIAGTLSGTTFKTLSTGWITTEANETGLVYISLGYMYSTYQMYLYPEHPMFIYSNGALKAISQISYEAQLAAETAQSQTEALSGEFRRVMRLDQETGLHIGDNQTGNKVLIDSDSVNIVMNGQKYSKFAANYVQFGQ